MIQCYRSLLSLQGIEIKIDDRRNRKTNGQILYDLNEDVTELVFEKLLKFAQSEKEEFIRYVNNQEFGTESYRPILYESIMDDAKGWEEFLFDQIKIIIEQSESGNKNAQDEISSIYYLTSIQELDAKFYLKAIEYFKTKLNSSSEEVKRAALVYLIDLHFEGKINMPYELQAKLQKQLSDKEYKTRLDAYVNLGDAKMLPKGFKQKIMDKFRTKFNLEHRRLEKAKEIGRKVVD